MIDPEGPAAQRIFALVKRIPEGFVCTYGDLAPGAPRQAGAALAACDDPTVPWHRVVRADGSLPVGARQRALLDGEGVPFKGRRVEMALARLPIEAIDGLRDGAALGPRRGASPESPRG